jgi:hypothetical protein
LTSRGRDAVLLAALVALPLAAALAGSRAGHSITLNFGPGDGPYIGGFAPEYEIDDKVATHWTTYHATVDLPLTVEAGEAVLAYRFARVFPETAVTEIALAGRTVDRFESRGGVFQERRATLGALPATPLAVRIDADSHERKDRGLKMDWLRLETPRGAVVRLRGAARWVPALVVMLAAILLMLGGWPGRQAAALVAPLALALAFGLWLNPWIVHRLLRGIPLALVVFGGIGILLARWQLARLPLLDHTKGLRAQPESVRILTALGLIAFLIRAAAVNHPDFYYPDLRTHARLVEKVQEMGLGFFVSPSRAIAEHGVWRTEAYGRTYAFPYTPAFHLPFAVLGLPYDTLLLAMKLTAAAVSVAPLILLWALARRLDASTAGAFLMVLIPTYTSRLSFAFLPSLFGHAVDMAFLLWIAGRIDRVTERRTWLAGAAWVAACQLAYVSGVINISVLVAVLATVTAIAGQRRAALAILAMGLAGSAVAVALYYRDFLPMVADVASRIAGGAARAPSRYPVQSFWAVAYARTRDFFDTVHPVLAALGLWLLWRPDGAATAERWPVRTRLTAAWLITYALLLLGRARIPDLFLHGHETLLVTPLVCLASGEALAALARRGGLRRVAAIVLLALLAIQGLAWQWRAVADQLQNAR